jgi:heat-inducible transcriptional repressor
MTGPALSERTRRVLSTLVREYIETGEPVASAALTRLTGLGVSPATIRNVLAQLEEMGFVHQPHTSAGRVPTDLGYRFYVDALLESRRAGKDAPAVEARLREQAGGMPLIDQLLSTTCHVLFQTSRHVGFALAPANERAVFQRIDFVPLSATRVLVVMVARGNQVTQKVVDIGEQIPPAELTQAANYLNAEFSGVPLDEVRLGILARLQQERTLYDQLLGTALKLAQTTFERFDPPTAIFIEGASSLLDDVADVTTLSVATLRTLMRMVEEKQRLVRLLTAYLDGPGITVVIGAEHPEPELRPFSLIAATWVDGDRRGSVGIIGPTRMRYARAISVVDGAAVAITRLLRDDN